MLLELTGLRHGSTSTIFCARPKKPDWHVRLGSDVRADAIVDRIVSNAVWLNIGEENVRRRMAERGVWRPSLAIISGSEVDKYSEWGRGYSIRVRPAFIRSAEIGSDGSAPTLLKSSLA